MQPLLLALSTFRKSDALVQIAIGLAKEEQRPLLVVFIVDENLARYLVGVEIPVGTRLREMCEQDMLNEHRKDAEDTIARIAREAEFAGILCEAIVLTGRFGIEITRIAQDRHPAKIILTRSNRPQWVRRFFGSPVDYVIQHAGCPVLEDGHAGAASDGALGEA